MRTVTRSLLALAGTVFAVTLLATGCDDPAAEAPDTTDLTAAAEELCPLTWEWVKAVGETFNEAASDVSTMDGAGDRRERWFAAFEEMHRLNDALGEAVEPLGDDEVLAPLVAEMERDLPRSDEEIDALEALFDEHPEIDDHPPQERTRQLIVRVEKVIDLPKPDLDEIDPSGALGAAFADVPSCQHAMKGADDGRIQSNG